MTFARIVDEVQQARGRQQVFRASLFLEFVRPVGEDPEAVEVGVLEGVPILVRRFAAGVPMYSGHLSRDVASLPGPVRPLAMCLPEGVLRWLQGIALRHFLRSLPQVAREEAPGNRPVASFGDLEIWASVPPRGWKTYFVAVRTLRSDTGQNKTAQSQPTMRR